MHPDLPHRWEGGRKLLLLLRSIIKAAGGDGWTVQITCHKSDPSADGDLVRDAIAKGGLAAVLVVLLMPVILSAALISKSSESFTPWRLAAARKMASAKLSRFSAGKWRPAGLLR